MVSQKPKYCKNFERNSHWRKLSMIMVWERYCNASPKPEFFLFSLFIFSFISQLISVRLGWNFWQMILNRETCKLMYNWSFLCVVLHKPTLLPSTFKGPGSSRVFDALNLCYSWSKLYSKAFWYKIGEKNRVDQILGEACACCTTLWIRHWHICFYCIVNLLTT